MTDNKPSINLKLISPLLIIGVLLILLPIFTIMIMDRLDKQKEFFTQRFLEKGVSLIRTFEAGTRAGMFTMQWGAKRIQAMLSETAMQPEVKYLMITSDEGRIIAHSNASMIGQLFDAMPDITMINQDSASIYHRLREQADGEALFEIVKRFAPVGPEFRRRHAHMGQNSYNKKEKPCEQCEAKDWCRPYFKSFDNQAPISVEHYIFAGLSMGKAQLARNKLLKKTILNGIIFFVLGCAGIFALFAFQAYRSTRASLNSTKVFSDNLIQNMPAGLITINSDYKITSMNKAAKDIFGEHLIKPYPQMIDLIKEIENSHKTLNQESLFLIRPDLPIPLDITAYPIKDNENKIIEFLFLFRDLRQIKELKKQVETNKRLAAIGKLAAGVAHEIRNPLSSIKGFVTYLGKRHENNASDKEATEIMVEEVERINRAITQLLEFAKPMEVHKKTINIQELISHSLKLVQSDLDKKNIKTKVSFNSKKNMFYTDNDRMNQVLLNLYINAIEALETEGLLEIEVLDAKENESIEIRIKDNGKGIDKALHDQIFDPYFTTKTTGTGLAWALNCSQNNRNPWRNNYFGKFQEAGCLFYY